MMEKHTINNLAQILKVCSQCKLKTSHLVPSFNLFHPLLDAINAIKKRACTHAKKHTHHTTVYSPEHCTSLRGHQNLSPGRIITETTNKPQTYDLHVFKESVIFVNSGI